ncbi:TPA: hypothetical protein H1016_01455 [archaeon]|uniref:Uncharacterized protein n=1 Tax=Candidatus Naiadarchaeum limnaeum TaxID=2756139 RepID=A0A832XI28_9ARCH|nr:hypothetical protein [Candidatus Naiadarchaeum limnaeum]
MATSKRRLKKRKKEYEEIMHEIVPPFEPLEPKKAKKKKHSQDFLQ